MLQRACREPENASSTSGTSTPAAPPPHAPRISDQGTNGESLMELARVVASELREKVRSQQGGIPTFFDNVLLVGLEGIQSSNHSQQASVVSPDDPGLSWQLGDVVRMLLDYARFRSHPRLVEHSQRLAESESRHRLPWEPDPLQLNATTGVAECLQWRGLPLFKSVFDLALYPMLIWETRPATIIELGSGLGTSAVWLADILRAFGIHAHLYSVDIRSPQLNDPGVTFLQGNCLEIEGVLPATFLESLPRPWLVIEDMHVNTLGVLQYFADLLHPGDYFIVEDSRSKQTAIREFMADREAHFMVDTRYTDYFGRNVTCSADSIFVRV
jgi:cephalosporin hydroxylase